VSDSTLIRSAAATAFRSPFASIVAHRKANRQGEVQVQLHAQRLSCVVQLSTWIDGTQALCGALTKAFAATELFPLPASTGQTLQSPLGLLIRTGPHEFVLIGENAPPLETLRQHVTPEIGSVLDLSHARCRVHAKGPKAVEALGKLFALDFREAAFAVGQVKLTGHHHVPCTIHRLSPQSFDLYLFSTYAHGQIESLLDAALEYGVELTLGN